MLEVGTKSPSQGNEPPVEILENVTSNGNIGVHIHDRGEPVSDVNAEPDGVSSLQVIPFFDAQPFQTGIDVFMPATEPADGTITFRNEPRGDASRPQVLNIPNWASEGHAISANLNDYVQGINTWAQCKKLKPSPC